ncbi:MAG TPA: inositol monophosphatase [Polyangiaceae bacterium]
MDPRILLIEPFLRDLGKELRRTQVTRVRVKGPMDVVSALDIIAEDRVTRFLAEHFAGDSLLSEESAARVDYASRIWVLDPLDGTVNLTKGLPFAAISLALLVDGSPVVGFIYDLFHDEMFSARAGEGAHCNHQPIHVTTGNVATIAVTTGVVRRLAARQPQQLVTLLTTCGKLRGLGAQALQLAYVAAGRLTANISLETKLWDNAAGALLVKEAGGAYFNLDAIDPFPIGPGAPALLGAADPCIAAAPTILDAIRPLLEALKD